MQDFLKQASLSPARIIFPEGNEPRIIKAVSEIKRLNIAEPILFRAEKDKAEHPACPRVDPWDEELVEKYAQNYYQLRKHKGMTLEIARKLLKENPVFTAALMVREGFADAFIAGASHYTKDVAKAVIHCIGPKNKGHYISSCFLIDTKREEFGYQGKFIFADCGIIIEPSAEQLAEIAIESGELFKKLFQARPYIALLSYSTQGSGEGESVEKVRQALKIVRERRPDLKIDGELQSDAAIVEEVARIKSPNSEVAGRANVLIFPDLNSGNICYKLIDKLLGALTLGPIFLGTAKPVSDLSRGCETEEIVLVSAIISIMAQLKEEGIDVDSGHKCR